MAKKVMLNSGREAHVSESVTMRLDSGEVVTTPEAPVEAIALSVDDWIKIGEAIFDRVFGGGGGGGNGGGGGGGGGGGDKDCIRIKTKSGTTVEVNCPEGGGGSGSGSGGGGHIA